MSTAAGRAGGPYRTMRVSRAQRGLLRCTTESTNFRHRRCPTRVESRVGRLNEALLDSQNARVKRMADANNDFVAKKPSWPTGISKASTCTFEYLSASLANRELSLVQRARICSASFVAAIRSAPMMSGFEPPAEARNTDEPRRTPRREASSSGVSTADRPWSNSQKSSVAISAVVRDPPEPTANRGLRDNAVIRLERRVTDTLRAQSYVSSKASSSSSKCAQLRRGGASDGIRRPSHYLSSAPSSGGAAHPMESVDSPESCQDGSGNKAITDV